MCDLSKGFKLCTCSDKKLAETEIDWRLDRKDDSLDILYRKGRAAIPHLSSQAKQQAAEIITLLNQNSCFDFNYQAQEDDFLRIRLNKENHTWAAFRFQKGAWVIDNSTSLDGWRSQLVSFQNGKIK